MRRQPYFPRGLADRPEWYHNYALRLLELGPGLGLVTADINASVADALYLEYVTGPWLTSIREFGPAGTSALDQLSYGPSGGAFVLPVLTAPPLPGANAPLPATVAVTTGALDRIFKYVQTIKARPGYTEAIGLLMGIVGSEDTTDYPAPTFTLKAEQGAGCQCVKLNFKKYGHEGVAVFGKRGTGGWELLGIDLSTPYLDERPLLVAGAPEVREYRLQFYDNAAPNGDFSAVQSVTVGP